MGDGKKSVVTMQSDEFRIISTDDRKAVVLEKQVVDSSGRKFAWKVRVHKDAVSNEFEEFYVLTR